MSVTHSPSSAQWPDDWHLWNHLSADDESAWAYLREALRGWISAHLRARLAWASEAQRREWAEECTQATCERILRKLHLYRGEGPLLGWCRVVAVNAANEWIRTDRRERLAVSAPLHEGIHATADPLDAADTAAEMQKIQALIDDYTAQQLSPREQQILQAERSETNSVAGQLGITPNNLYQIRHRALAKIRRHLESQGYTRQRLQAWRLL